MVRFAVNLYGAPAMDLKEFSTYRQKTNIGASLVVSAPLGQYDPAKLVNLSQSLGFQTRGWDLSLCAPNVFGCLRECMAIHRQ
jgi:hypothetical protein